MLVNWNLYFFLSLPLFLDCYTFFDDDRFALGAFDLLFKEITTKKNKKRFTNLFVTMIAHGSYNFPWKNNQHNNSTRQTVSSNTAFLWLCFSLRQLLTCICTTRFYVNVWRWIFLIEVDRLSWTYSALLLRLFDKLSLRPEYCDFEGK